MKTFNDLLQMKKYTWDDISEEDGLWWWASICSTHRERKKDCGRCVVGFWVCVMHNDIACEKCPVEKE